ncbi:hypothetical protein GYMLUDRAFT_50448 [Collybiopsis luxurians FD-317 M1]|uniref:Major facilitator superfamily (MFS) profile domain-containing protein n=1 Tax=Collybiopsis luxurians FD-317 M1 TaxID=944289 RepID=A0A0D0AN26_9AGAR|nr:hypothetical protein GYMLUDRAFT_50448 [Collybiopsis luxurians FD-317 M1]
MLWTVYEEDSEDSNHYFGPPPGHLDSFYDLSASSSAQDSVVEPPPPVPPLPNPGPSASGSGAENKNCNTKKDEISEKHVEEVVVPADDEDDEGAEHGHTHLDRDPNVEEPVSYPDGGSRAWLVVLGTFFSAFASFGYVNAWGVFQAYYEETALEQYSPSTIAWIGSVQYALVLFPALFSGRLFDLGIFKLPFLVASVLVVAATVLVGQCKEYWEFFLCQGIALGLGCGMVFGPAMGIIGQWFRRKRGIAMGLTALGSSVGGTVFPIAAQKLIPIVGFPWTMRILGLILLFALAVPNLTLARRLPPRNVSGGLFNFAAFKDPPFSAYAIAVITGFLGLYTVLTYIEVSALSVGVSPDLAFYLVSIANASSAFGRIIAGVMADRIGPLDFIAPTTLFAAALTFAWPFARVEASLIVIAILYGFMCGSFVAGLVLPVYQMGGVGDIGRRTGMIMTVSAAGALCGIPISGALNKATGGFEVVGYYAGSITVVSAIFMMITRVLMSRRIEEEFELQ